MGDSVEHRSISADTRSAWDRFKCITILAVFVALVIWLGSFGVMVFGMLCGLVILPSFFVNGLLIPLTFGFRCPGCACRSLSYMSCIPFGARFYRCKACGVRCQRDDPTDPWLDASGTEFDAYYSAKPPDFPISWQLGMAAMILLAFGAVMIGSVVAYALVPGASLSVSFVCWHLFFREVRVSPPPTGPAGTGLWDRDLDP